MLFHQLVFFVFLIFAISLAQAKDFCKEACWAVSASNEDLKKRYGSIHIPKKFNFAKKYDDQTMAIYKSCMNPHGAMAVFNQKISNHCSQEARQFCEQQCQKNDQINAHQENEDKLNGNHIISWVLIKGGEFMMGTEDRDNEKPRHNVVVKDFYMSKTEVTVAQYRKCVEAGVCSEPHWDDGSCFVIAISNFGKLGHEFRGDHQPVVCVDWKQARTFAKWVGGDLPSEAQWEYAARSEGKNIKYPWGNETATCEYAVMDDGGWGCGKLKTWEVCTKVGDQTAQGLCDMGGNILELVLDEWHNSYQGAPSEDIGWCSNNTCEEILDQNLANTSDEHPSSNRVGRGGSWTFQPTGISALFRTKMFTYASFDFVGFRVLNANTIPKKSSSNAKKKSTKSKNKN